MTDDRRKGSEVLIEVLRSEGVTHIFGNPGTTELPMIDALAAVPDIHYVLGLQESTVVGMADGYAQATGRPAFLNVHTAAGLGNAIGNLTNAKSANTPLVVTAGQQDYRHIITDPLLSGDLTGIAPPSPSGRTRCARSANWARCSVAPSTMRPPPRAAPSSSRCR